MNELDDVRPLSFLFGLAMFIGFVLVLTAGRPELLVFLVVVWVLRALYKLATLVNRARRPPGRLQPGSIRPAAPPGPLWHEVRARFTALQSRYAAYECDALAVLRAPALADVTVAETARFVDAFALAQSLLTDTEPHRETTVRFRRAVEAAEAAWSVAHAAAERIAHSALDPQERRAVVHVIELLESARDTGSEPERRAAYALAADELAALERATGLTVPRPAIAALGGPSRRELT